ncbi:tRNA (N6-threonylcarbamoyladenosine(37)-N6)-methyltransferase TrmO [Pontiella agarivorans]|uniref:tRNA (N6-threonylcarbamoyladenosine(37)-N6)-methyltransferase TrmO n=1 Tax=Pontiella agarivorans TaxID=3038953 RepID=A0ABU5MYS9_9BACT|nr:tRNA (N6-threonylcarbamoyladenosine(37)-N6)-methyltransferase TrmO [Pontiella agarivorans]MDZ8119361.1 tRNA (N6-threonylcarbamoyladenosine(37)-N6)-methyltransferase TrmO [Pontiella agarivorans]
MKTETVELTLIGTIRTPHTTADNIPVQPVGSEDEGVVELYPEFAEGLKDVDGFSHVMLLFHLHKMKPDYKLTITPFMDKKEHGVFATRSPARPAAIGLSTVKVKKVEGSKLYFEGADMLDGSPLIDIKPFFRNVDNRPNAISGWLEDKEADIASKHRSDDRFMERKAIHQMP